MTKDKTALESSQSVYTGEQAPNEQSRDRKFRSRISRRTQSI